MPHPKTGNLGDIFGLSIPFSSKKPASDARLYPCGTAKEHPALQNKGCSYNLPSMLKKKTAIPAGGFSGAASAKAEAVLIERNSDFSLGFSMPSKPKPPRGVQLFDG